MGTGFPCCFKDGANKCRSKNRAMIDAGSHQVLRDSTGREGLPAHGVAGCGPTEVDHSGSIQLVTEALLADALVDEEMH